MAGYQNDLLIIYFYMITRILVFCGELIPNYVCQGVFYAEEDRVFYAEEDIIFV